jgi:hypothetical protein
LRLTPEKANGKRAAQMFWFSSFRSHLLCSSGWSITKSVLDRSKTSSIYTLLQRIDQRTSRFGWKISWRFSWWRLFSIDPRLPAYTIAKTRSTHRQVWLKDLLEIFLMACSRSIQDFQHTLLQRLNQRTSRFGWKISWRFSWWRVLDRSMTSSIHYCKDYINVPAGLAERSLGDSLDSGWHQNPINMRTSIATIDLPYQEKTEPTSSHKSKGHIENHNKKTKTTHLKQCLKNTSSIGLPRPPFRSLACRPSPTS